jgi:hypothetical protein
MRRLRPQGTPSTHRSPVPVTLDGGIFENRPFGFPINASAKDPIAQPLLS